MPVREVLIDATRAPGAPPDLILRGGPYWSPVVLFSSLGALHLANWTISFLHGRFEAYLSLAFGMTFVLVAVASYLSRREIAILTAERRVRLRIGFRSFRVERFVPFNCVLSVRITQVLDRDQTAGRVELICGEECIECPPTPVARQEALCLAVLIGVPLVKVGAFPPLDEQRR